MSPSRSSATTEREEIVRKHLEWSDKQRRILTANGEADRFYREERGFAFSDTELPHYYLLQQHDLLSSSSDGEQTTTRSSTHEIFQRWKSQDSETKSFPIVGAWKRPLFYGGWEHSTDQDEFVFNLQTRTLFIDLRIPCTRDYLLSELSAELRSLEDLNGEQLSYFARQHIFAGYSRLAAVSQRKDGTGARDTSKSINNVALFDHCYTRHHCIDWNFVGVARSRPNKWWVEQSSDANMWKEWAYATDDSGQHYYCERWERLQEAKSPVLALRKSSGRDGVLIVVGDHFSYCLDREITQQRHKAYAKHNGSLVSLVDEVLKLGDLEAARAWLGIQGGHGQVSRGWQLDHCIEFWKEGSPLWSKADILVQGEFVEDCRLIWNQEAWIVFECSLVSVDDLRELLYYGLTT
jgi:hypothetical protein